MKNIFIATDVFVLNIHHDKITNYTPAENANCFFILCVRNIHLRPLSVKMTSHLSTMSNCNQVLFNIRKDAFFGRKNDSRKHANNWKVG